MTLEGCCLTLTSLLQYALGLHFGLIVYITLGVFLTFSIEFWFCVGSGWLGLTWIGSGLLGYSGKLKIILYNLKLI